MKQTLSMFRETLKKTKLIGSLGDYKDSYKEVADSLYEAKWVENYYKNKQIFKESLGIPKPGISYMRLVKDTPDRIKEWTVLGVGLNTLSGFKANEAMVAMPVAASLPVTWPLVLAGGIAYCSYAEKQRKLEEDARRKEEHYKWAEMFGYTRQYVDEMNKKEGVQR